MSNMLSAKYYQENKGRLEKKKAVKVIKIFLMKKKTNNQQYGCYHCKNLLEDEKQKLVKYRKQYYRMRKKKVML